MKFIKVVFLLVISNLVFADANIGIVTEVSFASISTTIRPGSAQFSIAGGFSVFGDCDQTYAAIAKEDTHLLSLLLMAKAQGNEVEIHLNANNK